MWQWPSQQPTSSAHNHYATSSLPYHRPQTHNIVSPHPHPLPVNPSSQFPPGGHYIYPSSTPTGEFSSLPSPYIANQVPVDGWAEQRQSVQSESVPLPYSSPLQPRGDVHITSPLPTLQPSPIVHPSQQATPTNVQPQPQPSPLPLPPSQTHTVTRSPFSMDFILREHAPPPAEPAEIAQPVVQYPQGARPTSGDLHDPVAPGYQISDVMYQTQPQSHPTLPHTHTSSPQLQQTIGQSYIEGGGVKQVTFDPGSHYGDQTKTGLPTFITSGETGERLSVGGFPTTNSPLPESRPFSENLQPFQLHSNYPQPTPGAPEKMDIEPDGNEAPYSPPELIPEGDQSGGLNQSHDHNGPPPRVGENFTAENQSFAASTYNSHQYRHSSSPGVGGVRSVTKPDHSQPNATKVDQNTPLCPDSPGSTGSSGLQIDMTESPTKAPHNETETLKPATPLRTSPFEDLCHLLQMNSTYVPQPLSHLRLLDEVTTAVAMKKMMSFSLRNTTTHLLPSSHPHKKHRRPPTCKLHPRHPPTYPHLQCLPLLLPLLLNRYHNHTHHYRHTITVPMIAKLKKTKEIRQRPQPLQVRPHPLINKCLFISPSCCLATTSGMVIMRRGRARHKTLDHDKLQLPFKHG